MEKARLTRDQAAALNEIFRKTTWTTDYVIDLHATGDGLSSYSALNDLSVSELARALYIGYEVESEFKAEDWVILQNGKIEKIEWINYSKNLLYAFGVGVVCIDDIERHATPEEIAEEKERRWWSKHGRDVWELRPGDLLVSDIRVFKEIREVNNDSVTFAYENYVAMDRLKLYYKVVCFAENRMDKHNG